MGWNSFPIPERLSSGRGDSVQSAHSGQLGRAVFLTYASGRDQAYLSLSFPQALISASDLTAGSFQKEDQGAFDVGLDYWHDQGCEGKALKTADSMCGRKETA